MHDQPTGLRSAIHEWVLRSVVGTYRGGETPLLLVPNAGPIDWAVLFGVLSCTLDEWSIKHLT
jgi:hypothetical protein